MRRGLATEKAYSKELDTLKAWKPIEPDPQPLERHPNPDFPELDGGERHGVLLWTWKKVPDA